MTARFRIVVPALALSLLAACAREEDPSKAGFFSGIGNIVTGTYDQRVSQQQQDLAATERERDAQRDRAQRSRAENERLARQREDMRRQIAQLNTEMRQLDNRLAEAQRTRGANAAQLAEVKARADQLKAERDRLAAAQAPSEQDRAAIERLRREREQLM
jgi:chromosome segregation ATPase